MKKILTVPEDYVCETDQGAFVELSAMPRDVLIEYLKQQRFRLEMKDGTRKYWFEFEDAEREQLLDVLQDGRFDNKFPVILSH